MKALFVSLCLCYVTVGFSQRPAFHFSDTVFSVGQKKILQVKYLLGKPQLDTLNGPVIDSLFRFLVAHPSVSIEIGAHYPQDPKKSTMLSDARAKCIADTLSKMGINPKRLTRMGYGAFQPLVSNAVISKAKTLEEKRALIAMNRRTELKITSTTFEP